MVEKNRDAAIQRIIIFILISFIIIFVSLFLIFGVIILFSILTGLTSVMIILRLLPLYAFFIIMIIGGINYIKLYFYLKRNRPEILKDFLHKFSKHFSFLPEFMRYDPQKFYEFIFNIKKGNDKNIKFYKKVLRICIILTIILFIMSYIVL